LPDIVFLIARSDPTAFVRGLAVVIIDEVQRVPELMLAIKKADDDACCPARYSVCTPSAVDSGRGIGAAGSRARRGLASDANGSEDRIAFIVTLKDRTLSPVAQLFIDCAREIARPLAKMK
jgi:hypothetical protein